MPTIFSKDGFTNEELTMFIKTMGKHHLREARASNRAFILTILTELQKEMAERSACPSIFL
jgi:hypothetical protein